MKLKKKQTKHEFLRKKGYIKVKQNASVKNRYFFHSLILALPENGHAHSFLPYVHFINKGHCVAGK